MPQQDTPIPAVSQYVEVALPLPLRQTFTYRLPAGFSAEVVPGARLIVPFGRRFLTGYAVALSSAEPDNLDVETSSIKDVADLIDREPLITEGILRLTEWTARYYAASWGEVLKASLPAGINSTTKQSISITEAGRSILLRTANFKPVKWRVLQDLSTVAERRQSEIENEFGKAAVRRALRELQSDGYVQFVTRTAITKVKPKLRKAVRLGMDGAAAAAIAANAGQAAVIAALAASSGEMPFQLLLEQSGVSASAINTLTRQGAVEVFVREVRRDPLVGESLSPAGEFTLNADQANALEKIEAAIRTESFNAILLHGVTGSGKTEIYIRSIRAALAHGRSALMLVPEIALTPIFSRRLRTVFGDDVAILHSNLSPGERFDEWRRVRSGDARVAIGTRSAIFAPLRNIGLIIVDEEHDASYSQQESPYYNARDTAVMRASLSGATVVLGSATPALETFQNARTGKYQYLRLANRIENRPLADVELIDMRDVFRHAGKDVALSPRLIEEIAATHRRREQSIILLNRRGYSSFVLCRSCGETLRCKNCDITLTYHRRESRMVCHYCGYNSKVPDTCPFCSSEFLYFIGEGTEQLEEMLVKKFPGFRVARIDRDTMARKGEMSRVLTAFDKGEVDMLVGTQMLSKGHDFHNVTLVGVISVDIGLGMPDFRSAERTFQLLTQVAGRAGRGDLPGRVLIQTYYPEHYALKFARDQNFEGFFAEEIKFRKRLNYPPFVVLASILVKHADYSVADKTAKLFRTALDRSNLHRSCQVLGPASASIARLKNEFRLQIIIKSVTRSSLRECLDLATADAASKGADLRCVHIEIDPVNLL